MADQNSKTAATRDPDATADAVLARVRHALRRSFDYGSGLFVVGVIFATVTALSLRVAVPGWQEYMSAYATAIRTLFDTTMESSPTGNEKVILAVVPASIAAAVRSQGHASTAQEAWVLQTAGLQCGETKACPEGAVQAAIRAAFGQADQLTENAWAMCATEQSAGRRSGTTIGACIDNFLQKAFSPPAVGSGYQDTSGVEYLSAVVKARLDPGAAAGLADQMVTPCPDFHPHPWNAQISTLPAPECDIDATFSDTTLLVPQQLVPQQIVRPSEHLPWTPRVSLEITESRLFTQVADRVDLAFARSTESGASLPAPGDANYWPQPRPVAAYFIAVDGLLRYWTETGTSANPSLAQANPSRDWTQSPYFYPLLMSASPVSETDLYMDVAGHGLVRTVCYPVSGERIMNNAEGGHQQADYGFSYDDTTQTLPRIVPQFIGAVCVDLGFPGTEEINKGLLQALQRNPLIDAAIYDISEDGAGHVTTVTNEEREQGGWPHAELIRAVMTGACGADYGRASGTVVTNDVSTCILSADEQVDLIPLYRPAPGRLVMLAISPHSPTLPMQLKASLSSALLGVICLVVCGFMLGGSQTEGKLVRQMGRLRNLPVAMVECDTQDRVIAANDRLEEMVMRRMRKFGVKEAGAELRFNELFENFVQGVRPGGGGGLDAVVSDITGPGVNLRRVQLDDEIWRARVAGRRSVYFASVREEGPSPLKWTKGVAAGREGRTWVKIIASPVISAGDIETILAATEGRTVNWVPTFGVIIEATAEEAKLIEAEMKRMVEGKGSEVGK